MTPGVVVETFGAGDFHEWAVTSEYLNAKVTWKCSVCGLTVNVSDRYDPNRDKLVVVSCARRVAEQVHEA